VIPVTVLVVVKNAASVLATTLDSLNGFSEIIIVDSSSGDGTEKIAQERNIPVIQYKWNGHYPKKRQWTLQNVPVKNDWIFFVDADEIVTDKLKQEILAAIRSDAAAFFVHGQPVWEGQKLKFGRWNNKIVLFRKGAVRYPEFPDAHTAMGEIEGHYQPVVHGEIGQLQSPITHHCADDMNEWIARHKRYASWQAEMEIKGIDFSKTEHGARKIMKKIFTALPLRPVVVFIDSYVLKKGALDGRGGFRFATARARYYRMVATEKTARSRKASGSGF
jgi:hypothetical protein